MKEKTKEQLLNELEAVKERLIKLENADIERQKVNEALSESEAKYRLLFDAAPVGIGIADLKGKINDANKSMQEMSGYSLEEYRAIGVEATYADPEERKLLLKSLREKGYVRDWEERLKRKDGSEYYALLNADILELGGHKFLLGIIRDISQSKRNEVALNAALAKAQEEKNKSEAIISALGDRIIIQDTDYKIIYQNQVQNEIYGERTGELCYKAYEGIDEICEDCPVERTFRDGKIHRSERRVAKDTGVSYFELTSSPLKDSSGKIIAGIKIVRDITESRQLQEKLREGEQFLENIFSSIQDSIGIIDSDMNIIRTNKTTERWYPHAIPLVGKKCFKAYHNRKERCELCPAWETLKTGKSAYKEVPKHGPGGKQVGWAEIHSYPLNDMITGQMKGVIEYVRDITERKHIEEELKQSEEKYRLLIENINEGVFVIQDAKMQFANQAFARITGYSIEEIIGTDFHIFVAPEDLEMVHDSYYRRQKREEVAPEYEFHVLRKDGGKTLVNMNVGLVTYLGRVASMGILKDITEQKRAEKLIKQSEEKYRNLVEMTTDIIYMTDKNRKHVFMNDAGLRILEALPEEVIGHHWSKWVYPEDREISFQKFSEMMEKGTDVFEFENRYFSNSGKVINVLHNVRILRNEKGEVIGTQGIARDITERERSEEALRLSNLVVENSQTVLFRWKAEDSWPVEFVSNNVAQFGYSAEDFLSGSLLYASIIHPDDLERVSKEVREHSESGDDRFHQEYRIIAKNGAIHWIDDRTVIERNSDRQITHYQGIIIDITERKLAEEAIKKYNMDLEESNRMKELFTDIMHHDLLNPLNVANGYVELFLEDEKNPQKKSYLETVKRNLVKGMELIDNATKLSKLKSLKSIGFDDLDLKIIVTEVIENLTPLAVNAGMSIENDLETRLPVRANKIIEDIFTNIIINAIKYAPQGKRIVVKGQEEANSCLVSIIDFGEGIKDTEKKLIFERFNRNEKKGVKGSGLGLAIAGRIVELHNGRIWVEDNLEGGAVFVVEIPKY